MVFSSNIFLFLFFPCVLLGWFCTKRNRRLNNLFLTAASLFFYAWGEPIFVLVMMGSIAVNWLFGLWLKRRMDGGRRTKPVIAVMCVFNLTILGIFKYLTFILRNVSWAFHLSFPIPEIALPVGISFFTFQAMSYVIDCARGKGRVQKNLMNVALYISFFPQLIAGPIVRYETVANEIENRRETAEDFVEGMRRFLIGLCKKVLLANNLGLLVDTVFGLDKSSLSVATAWIAAAAYLIQVYYDFSGYSDMAIGLGRIFGFHFLENFRFPFLAKSVAGFWRRWHISLGTWFQDYVYIPLGGSRVRSRWRLMFNILVTWSLTGLWHGADWTFLIWGTGFAVMLIIEKFTGLGKKMESSPFGHFYAMFIVVTITILIRVNGIGEAGAFYGAMFGMGAPALADSLTVLLLREFGLFFLASILCSLPVADAMRNKLHIPQKAMDILGAAALLVLTVLSVTYIATGSYNPFIYYNF